MDAEPCTSGTLYRCTTVTVRALPLCMEDVVAVVEKIHITWSVRLIRSSHTSASHGIRLALCDCASVHSTCTAGVPPNAFRQ